MQCVSATSLHENFLGKKDTHMNIWSWFKDSPKPAESMCHNREMPLKGVTHTTLDQSCGLCVSTLYCVCLETHR